MRERYRLVGLKNSDLLAGLSDLVRRSNELTGDVLAHVAELEERKLCLELGFASAFAYCVEALGMSEGAAGRRVTGARVCHRFPEAFALVARGDLHLSALCALGPHLNTENARELFEACQGKTRRQVEGLLAARFPRPDVKEQIRRLPVRATTLLTVSESETSSGSRPSEPDEIRKEAVAQAAVSGQRREAASAETAEIPAGPGLGTRVPPGPSGGRRRELEPLSPARFGVHFTADVELRELIERARELASHRLPKGDLASLMKLALATFVQHEEKRRFALGSKPRKVVVVVEASAPRGTDAPSTPPGGALPKQTEPRGAARLSWLGKRGRYIAAAVRREVYVRDGGRCSFVSEDGRRCEACALLEFDHIEPWATLGASAADNLRLRCRAHNGLHARNCFGARHIAGKIAARRRQAQLRTTSSDESLETPTRQAEEG
jgi:hypothetical protein